MKAQLTPTKLLTYIALANASITLANQLNHYYTVYKTHHQHNRHPLGFTSTPPTPNQLTFTHTIKGSTRP